MFFVGVLGAAAYGAFFVPLGDATLATHVREIWNSRVVQEKLSGARSGVEGKLSRKLERALANKTSGKIAGSDISDADRAQLESLLRKNK